MRPQISRKTLVQLSLVVVLAAILVYLGFGGRSAPSRRGVSNQTAGRTAPPPVVPPAAPAARTAGPTSGAPGAPPQPGAPVAQTPSAASQPRGGQTPGAGAAQQPAPSALPGAKPLAPSGAAPTGSGAPAPATAPAKPQDPELAVVGTGARGRHDPFAPLVSNEPARATPSPTLPPPPGVGLPMPPGFAAPGGPGATQPPSPGAGMKVTGIMGSRARVAIIEVDGQTHIVGVGDRIGDAVVVSILPEKVIMKQHNVTFELVVGGERSS